MIRIQSLLLILLLTQWTQFVSAETSDEWQIGPRIGVSPYTGILGVEFQKKQWGFDLGLLGAAYIIGTRYYFQEDRKTWYAGPFYWNGRGDFYNDLKYALGIGGGHQWRFKSGWDFSMGWGLGYYQENESADGIFIIPELTFGYLF